MKQLNMSWKSPQGNAGLEIFLGQIQGELFEGSKKRLFYSSFWKEGLECIRSLANDKSIVLKKPKRARV